MALLNQRGRKLISLAYAMPMTIAGSVFIGTCLDTYFQSKVATPVMLILGVLSGALQTWQGFNRHLADNPKKESPTERPAELSKGPPLKKDQPTQ